MPIILKGTFGSSSRTKTAVANEDVIQKNKPVNAPVNFKARKLSFYTLQECHIRINDGPILFLAAEQAIVVSLDEKPIKSLIISEPFIDYFIMGSY